MVAEIFAGLQGLKALTDGVKAFVSIRDERTRNDAAIELQRQLMDLGGEMMAAQQREATLLERVRSLEAEVARLKQGTADLERYELKAIGGGATAYMVKPDMRGAEPPHWLCPTCYANGKKSLLQFSVKAGHIGSVYRCAGCNGHTTVHGQPRWVE